MRLRGIARLYLGLDTRINITSKRVGRRTWTKLNRLRSVEPSGRENPVDSYSAGSGADHARTHLDRQAGLNLDGQRYAGRILLLLLRRKHRGSRPVRRKAQSADVLHVLDLHHVLVHRWATLTRRGTTPQPGRRRRRRRHVPVFRRLPG